MGNTTTPQVDQDVSNDTVVGPGIYTHYNVNDEMLTYNYLEDENPTGGSVRSIGLQVDWQNGPRSQADTDELLPPNGAFVEDVIYTALQRLQFFQDSKFSCRANAIAITHLESALQTLKHRQLERSHRGVEGSHEV
jgi:hypothetical protein